MSPQLAFCETPCGLSGRKFCISSKTWTCALTSDSPSKTGKGSETPSPDESFSVWATNQQINMSALSLQSFAHNAAIRASGQRGMAALRALERGDLLISVRKATTLQVTSLDRNRTPFPSKVSQETWKELPWYARLALLLLDAKQDEDSSFQPWISRLPSSFDTPFHWSDMELKELQSPHMTRAVHEQRKSYRKLYDKINSTPGNELARGMKYDDFVWAIECIRSRAFSGPLEVAPFKQRLRLFFFILTNTIAWPALHLLTWQNALNGGLTALFAISMYDIILPRILKVVQGVELKRYAMTPGIDFLNHSSSVTGKAEVSYEYFTDKFVVQAGEDYKTGDQVFISYGAQSNDSLLQFYGFVEVDNPADTYTFGKDVEGLLGAQAGTLLLGNSGFDNKIVKAVSAKFSGKKESAEKALLDLCAAEIGSLQTTLEEDIELLRSGYCEDKPRLHLAVRYRVEKKNLLTRTQQ